jgi:hypothetical protein
MQTTLDLFIEEAIRCLGTGSSLESLRSTEPTLMSARN